MLRGWSGGPSSCYVGAMGKRKDLLWLGLAVAAVAVGVRLAAPHHAPVAPPAAAPVGHTSGPTGPWMDWYRAFPLADPVRHRHDREVAAGLSMRGIRLGMTGRQVVTLLGAPHSVWRPPQVSWPFKQMMPAWPTTMDYDHYQFGLDLEGRVVRLRGAVLELNGKGIDPLQYETVLGPADKEFEFQRQRTVEWRLDRVVVWHYGGHEYLPVEVDLAP